MTEAISPALIIGLGGTGQWVLTYVKNNLLESFGKVPLQIRLLSFDTTSEETEALKGEPAEEAARVGQVRLESGSEFVYLGGNIKSICEEVRAGQHAHIGRWLPADAYLGGKENQIGLSDDDFNLARGAGTRRPFGRMAIFYDLTLVSQSLVWGKIHDSLQSIASAMSKPMPIEVYVVCSLAGGTGSGMFIDIAHLSRLVAGEQIRCEVAVRGFLVLPSVFQSVLNVDHVMPNAFAAMRELNRFMTLFGEDYPIDYTDDLYRHELHTVYSSKLFDSCFLIDAERSQKSLRDVLPKYGVYPSVADCITMLLDPQAGDTFQQHYKNVNNRVASIQKQRGVALYSSLGTYSHILPVDDILQSCSLRFAQEFLEDHFARLIGPSEPQIRERGMQRNRSFDGSARDAMGFLKQGSSQSGVRNTPFVQGVALKISRDIEDLAYVRQIASSGLDLIEMLRPSGEDPEIVEMNRRTGQITSVRLADEVHTSEQYGDSSESAAVRIPQQVEAFKRKYLGELVASTGRRSGGELQRAFAAYAEINLRRFRDALQERMNFIFDDTGALAEQSSQLGYAQAFLAQVVKAFNHFTRLIEQARRQRQRDGDMAYANEDVEQSRKRLNATKNKTNIVDRLRKTAVRAQQDYIDAEQYLVDLDIEELVYAELIDVSNAHREVAQALLDDVNRWVAVWATGDVARGELSVLRLVQDAQHRLEQHRQEKELIRVHQYVTDEAYEEALYKQLSSGKFEDLLKRLQWTCTDRDGQLAIELGLDGRQLQKELRAQPVAEVNFEALLQAVQPYFADIQRETIATRLAELYKAESLAEEILDLAKPMLRFRREDPAASDAEDLTFVSIDRREAIPFWGTVEKALKSRLANIKDAQIISAADPSRCVVLSTTDLVGVTAIQSLHEARKWYDGHWDDKRLLHIFPAETYAVQYEERLDTYPFSEQVRHFTPRVTAILENESKLEHFVLAYAFGVVKIEDSPEHRRQRQYMLRVNRERRFDRTFELTLTKPATRPSLFEAIHTFIFQRPVSTKNGAEDLVVSVDGNLSVELSRVDDAIALREYIIKSGLEYLVNEFSSYLRIYRDLKSRTAAIENEFRCFISQNTHEAATLGPDELASKAQDWLEDIRDLIPREYHGEIADRISRILLAGTFDSDNPTRLRHHVEDVIEETVARFRRSRDQGERDLGAIMYMVIWDYLQNLEQK